MIEKPKVNKYFLEGKDYTSVKADVNVEAFGVVVSGTIARLSQEYDKEVYIENNHAIIPSKKKEDLKYGFRRADSKSCLELLGLAGRNDEVRILVEGDSEESKKVALRLAAIVMSPGKFEIDKYMFERNKD